jgi:magnesium transporter
MDATVGFINISQNKIIKIFSVASVALLPPTLVASIYGMNLQFPEFAILGSLAYPVCGVADVFKRCLAHVVLL